MGWSASVLTGRWHSSREAHGGSAATTELFLAAGAAVCMVARNPADLDSAARELGGGEKLIFEAGSVVDPSVQARSVERCIAELGGLHILINNAAILGPLSPTLDAGESEITETLAINQLAPLQLSRLAWTAWMREHGGSIVNVSSYAGLRPRKLHGIYGITKAAIDQLTRQLAFELALRSGSTPSYRPEWTPGCGERAPQPATRKPPHPGRCSVSGVLRRPQRRSSSWHPRPPRGSLATPCRPTAVRC
jgi:NAD(P)-dependent dehydrogenase (short-subunit alcohol dehydrogenase family)